jgi:hypothetical protein
MENIVTWRLAAVAAIALATLTGCEQLRSYKEPTTGARARVRIVGRQPLLYSHKTCDRDDMRTSGFAYFGNKRHDLHMPNPVSGNADATEYYVVADVNLTVSFRDGGDELGAPRVTRSSTKARSFVRIRASCSCRKPDTTTRCESTVAASVRH